LTHLSLLVEAEVVPTLQPIKAQVELVVVV
jgi:hypothetical protein